MTDQQLMTLALAVIIPLAMLLYSNSRIGDVKSSVNETKETLRAEISETRETLRADMATMRAEFKAEMGALLSAIERLDTKVETKLLVHELEHHRK